MIRINHIIKSFNNATVLHDISAEFEPGKTNLTIGASGSGKTVLLKTLVGLHEADSGEIWYDDILFNRLPFDQKKNMRKHIGMLFQGAALFDFATVEENVMFPLTMFTGQSYAEKRERVDFCLNRVNLVNVEKRYPAELSGGMQKRVGIARAIALKPSYLFCDEPNSGLDPNTAILIDNLIHEITQEYGITTIVNTHDMNSVMEIGDKVMFIHQGHKWWEGSSNDILHADNKELNDFVFASSMTKQFKALSSKGK
jgi:phospholipid/cholesterol/gamma-HCH transport system ATP-binding protein